MHETRVVTDMRVGQEDAGETRLAGHGGGDVEAVQLLAEVRRGVQEPAFGGHRVHHGQAGHQATVVRVIPAGVLLAAGLGNASILGDP